MANLFALVFMFAIGYLVSLIFRPKPHKDRIDNINEVNYLERHYPDELKPRHPDHPDLTIAARHAALTYIDCINTKDLPRLLALFADDGQLNHPYGVFKGKDKLSEFYGGLVMKADTQLSIGRIAAEGKVCSVEVIGRSPQAPDKAQYAIDLFEVNNEGLVSELAIYYRNFDMK